MNRRQIVWYIGMKMEGFWNVILIEQSINVNIYMGCITSIFILTYFHLPTPVDPEKQLIMQWTLRPGI